MAEENRFDARQAYVLGGMDERKAVSRYLLVRAGRAIHYRESLPWWAFMDRIKARWLTTAYSLAAADIEAGDHVTDKAVWMVEVRDGVILGREAFKRDEEAAA